MPSTDNCGFTLIELMIVVAVIAILAAIAYPSFNSQVRKARRADAISNLKSTQLQLEKWRVDHISYDGTPASLLSGFSTKYYTYALSGASATGYTIKASAQGGQTTDPCGDLSIVKAGAIIENKTSTNASSCW